MTVQKDLVKNIYVGNSSTKEFPFTFDISKKHPEYVKVYIVDENGIQHESTDFTIDIDSKKITYPKNGEALASNKKIVIIRELPLQQQMNLENNGPYFAEDIEQAFDDAVMVSQQLAEKLSRALAFGVEVDGSEFSTIIPMVPGKSFRVSDDGKSIETTEDPAKVIPIAESLLSQTTQQATIATQKAEAAAESALSAADSEVNAETAMTQSRNSATLAQKWAESTESPDGQGDSESPTGKTQSAKEWAVTAKTWAEQANILTVNNIPAVNKNIDLNMKFFKSLSQLGLEYATVTFEDIADTLPLNSMLVINVASTAGSYYAPNLNIPVLTGTLIVQKGTDNIYNIAFEIIPNTSDSKANVRWMGSFKPSTQTWSGWNESNYVVEQVQKASTGYIKYADGRMEQWGIIDVSALDNNKGEYKTITFSQPFIDTTYREKLTLYGGGSGFAKLRYCYIFSQRTTTSMQAYIYADGDAAVATKIAWEVKGWWK